MLSNFKLYKWNHKHLQFSVLQTIPFSLFHKSSVNGMYSSGKVNKGVLMCNCIVVLCYKRIYMNRLRLFTIPYSVYVQTFYYPTNTIIMDKILSLFKKRVVLSQRFCELNNNNSFLTLSTSFKNIKMDFQYENKN